MLKIGGLYLSRLHFMQELGYIVSLSNNIKSDCLAAKEPLLKVFHFLKKKNVSEDIIVTIYPLYPVQYISTISSASIYPLYLQCLYTISCTSVYPLYPVPVFMHYILWKYISITSSVSIYPQYPVPVFIRYILWQYIFTIFRASIYPLYPAPVYIH